MAILSTDDFPSIRGILDTTIEASDLPDAVIALSVYAARAELLLLQRDSLALTRTGVAAQHIKLAAIFFTASLLAPAIPAITSFKADEVQYARTIDWGARASELRSLAEAEVDAVLYAGFEDDADRPTAFTTAGAGRSGSVRSYPFGVIPSGVIR